MRCGFSILLLAVFCLGCLAGMPDMPSFYSRAKHIAELTPKDFDDVVLNTNQTTVVEFYAPWCHYCREFKNKYKKASKIASEFVQFASVDCNKAFNKPLCARYKITSFPTVIIFRAPKILGDGVKRQHSVDQYRGPREIQPLVQQLKGTVKNYSKRISAHKLDKFFDMTNAKRNRTLLITDKSSLSPIVKSISVDFLGALDFAYTDVKREGVKDKLLKLIPSLDKNFQVPLLVGVSKENGVEICRHDPNIGKWTIEHFLSKYGTPNDGPFSERGLAMASIYMGKVKSFDQYRRQTRKEKKEHEKREKRKAGIDTEKSSKKHHKNAKHASHAHTKHESKSMTKDEL